MSDNKSYMQTEYELKEEIKSISQLSSHVFTQDGYDLLHFSLKRIRLLGSIISIGVTNQ